jgi:chemotaxis protein MotB
MAEKRPIIVIKKKGGHGGHHGGAWKVAYADFVTAMMALFIVLWLLNSTPQVKKAVAGYFQDPKSSMKETGIEKNGDDQNIPIDRKNVENLKEQIEKAIHNQKDLEKLAKQIEITITPEGLRIELIEGKNGTFFQSGSATLSTNGRELLAMLAGQLKSLPNHLLIEGHTDAQAYSRDSTYTNWELSADRANSARRLLQQDGVRQDQVSQVRGYADQMLHVKNDPYDPSNRRISLIVQWSGADAVPAIQLAGTRTSATVPATKTPSTENSPAPGAAAAKKPAAGTAAAHSVPSAAKGTLFDSLAARLHPHRGN